MAAGQALVGGWRVGEVPVCPVRNVGTTPGSLSSVYSVVRSPNRLLTDRLSKAEILARASAN